MEKREFLINSQAVELREGEDGKNMIVGEAIVFNRESNAIYGQFVEKIMPGALDEADMSRVMARTNHNTNELLGTIQGGTLRLIKTERGLSYEVDVPDTTAGRDAKVYVERGDIQGSSFAFEVDYETERWIDRSAEKLLPLREIYDIRKVHDVSPVVNPAYPSSTAGLRSEDDNYPMALRSMDKWKENVDKIQSDKELREMEMNQVELRQINRKHKAACAS